MVNIVRKKAQQLNIYPPPTPEPLEEPEEIDEIVTYEDQPAMPSQIGRTNIRKTIQVKSKLSDPLYIAISLDTKIKDFKQEYLKILNLDPIKCTELNMYLRREICPPSSTLFECGVRFASIIVASWEFIDYHTKTLKISTK